MPQAGEDLHAPEADVDGEQSAEMLQFVTQDEEQHRAPTEPPRREVEGEQLPEQEVETTDTREVQEEQPEEETPRAEQEQQPPEVEESEEYEDPIYAVKVNGRDVEVPLSELLMGYSRESVFTRKTQALAHERQEFESQQRQNQVERERLAQLFDTGQKWLTSLGPAEPNWEELRRSDPAEFAAQLTEHQQRRDQVRELQTQQEQLRQKTLQEQQQALHAHVEVEKGKLADALPEWEDPEVAQTEGSAMHEYGLSQGFSDEELGQVYDHRAVLVLRKAMLYDKLQSGKAKVVNRARKAPVIRPGASQTRTRKPAVSRLSRAQETLAKTGTEKAARSVFFEALEAGEL